MMGEMAHPERSCSCQASADTASRCYTARLFSGVWGEFSLSSHHHKCVSKIPRKSIMSNAKIRANGQSTGAVHDASDAGFRPDMLNQRLFDCTGPGSVGESMNQTVLSILTCRLIAWPLAFAR